MIWRPTSHDGEPQLPVAPMLDMAFQLLAFFILIYHPAAVEHELPLRMAHRSAAGAPVAALTPRPSICIQVVHADDSCDRLAYRVRAADVAQTCVDANALAGFLATCPHASAIRIGAERGIQLAAVASTIDVAAQAGFCSIGFDKPADDRP